MRLLLIVVLNGINFQFISLIKTIKRLNFDLVYDLQGLISTRFYRKLLSQSIEWIGCHQDKNHPQDSFSI